MTFVKKYFRKNFFDNFFLRYQKFRKMTKDLTKYSFFLRF
jgi:hypothetical protein